MQGLIRLYLAACVVHSHIWHYMALKPVDTWFGRIAVPGSHALICFFMLSGFVAGMQLDRHFSTRHEIDFRGYYLDRFVRIYPTYLVIVVAALPIYLGFGPKVFDLTSPANAARFAIVNLAPITMPLIPAADVSAWNVAVAPPAFWNLAVAPTAWSLGVECVFYALAPWLFFAYRNKPAILFYIVVMLLLLELPLRSRSDLVNYLDPLFNLKFFLCGGLGFLGWLKLRHSATRSHAAGLALLAIFLLLASHAQRYLVSTYSWEAILFYFAFLAVIVAGALTAAQARLDQVAGHISYPLFLVHVPVCWVLRGSEMGANTLYVTVFAISLALSLVAYFAFDRWVNIRRHQLQRPIQPLTALVRERPGGWFPDWVRVTGLQRRS